MIILNWLITIFFMELCQEVQSCVIDICYLWDNSVTFERYAFKSSSLGLIFSTSEQLQQLLFLFVKEALSLVRVGFSVYKHEDLKASRSQSFCNFWSTVNPQLLAELACALVKF